jgi:hypothetical protein
MVVRQSSDGFDGRLIERFRFDMTAIPSAPSVCDETPHHFTVRESRTLKNACSQTTYRDFDVRNPTDELPSTVCLRGL